jgi:D-alanyl-D-alanine carboxypeptidase-like protein
VRATSPCSGVGVRDCGQIDFDHIFCGRSETARAYEGHALFEGLVGTYCADSRYCECASCPDSGQCCCLHRQRVVPRRVAFTGDMPTAGRRHRRAMLTYRNSNRLVRDSDWEVGLSKTGYIGKAGRCLVMQATIAAKPMIIVLLDSVGKVARLADANRIKHWLEGHQVAISATARIKPGM